MTKDWFVKVDEVEGFYHRPEWYKPLAFGKNIYLNVTYLLPGIEMVMGSKREKEAELLERVIFTLEGTLEVACGEEKFEVLPHTAFIVPLEPGTPFVVRNVGQETASFLAAMSPPPHPELKTENKEQLMKRYLDNNRIVKSPAEMNEIIGKKAP